MKQKALITFEKNVYFVMSFINKNKKSKQTLESVQYGLEIIFKFSCCVILLVVLVILLVISTTFTFSLLLYAIK